MARRVVRAAVHFTMEPSVCCTTTGASVWRRTAGLTSELPFPLPPRLPRYVKSELYERAEAFFARASALQPSEVKWRLMVASCRRRAGALAPAFEAYAGIADDYPENAECALAVGGVSARPGDGD